MIERTIERDAGAYHAPKRVSQFGARRVKNCQVVKSGGALRWWRAAETFPRVKTDVVVIASGRDERGSSAKAHR
jgi:hypothetical protein